MTLIKKNPKTLDSWKKLQSNFNNLSQKKLADYFTEDPNRIDNLSIIWKSFYVDFSKNLLDKLTLKLLIQLAKESGLKEAISSYFEGEKINETEERAVLHTALRQTSPTPVVFEGKDIVPDVNKVNDQMFAFAEDGELMYATGDELENEDYQPDQGLYWSLATGMQTWK